MTRFQKAIETVLRQHGVGSHDFEARRPPRSVAVVNQIIADIRIAARHAQIDDAAAALKFRKAS